MDVRSNAFRYDEYKASPSRLPENSPTWNGPTRWLPLVPIPSDPPLLRAVWRQRFELDQQGGEMSIGGPSTGLTSKPWQGGAWVPPGHDPYACLQCERRNVHTEAEARAAVAAMDSKDFDTYYCPVGQTWHLILFRSPGHEGMT